MKNMNSKVLLGVAVAVGLAALVFLAGPIVSASMWKSSTLDATNNTIDGINETNRDITRYISKLNPTDKDYAELIVVLEEQNTVVTDARNALKPVGGIAIVDVTGEYAKAEQTHDDLAAAYDEMIDLNNAQLSRTKAEKEVSKAMSQTQNLSTAADFRAAAKSFKAVAKQIGDFASSEYGTALDKKYAAAFSKFATTLEKFAAAYDAQDVTQLQALSSDLESQTAALDTLGLESEKETLAQQTKFDENVDKLNEAAQGLE